MRTSLTWNPKFLFLKSNFVSRKETTGKYAGFRAVFCGQSSISLHSCVQDWDVLLWLLYCFTVEVVRAKNLFFFSSDYSIFLLFCSLFLKIIFVLNIPWHKSFQVVILSTCIACRTLKWTHPGELPSWFGHGVRTDGEAKAGHCLLTLSREGQTSPLALDIRYSLAIRPGRKGWKHIGMVQGEIQWVLDRGVLSVCRSMGLLQHFLTHLGSEGMAWMGCPPP